MYSDHKSEKTHTSEILHTKSVLAVNSAVKTAIFICDINWDRETEVMESYLQFDTVRAATVDTRTLL